MNLYKIIVKHFAYDDSCTATWAYTTAENESELLDKIFENPTYWANKDIDHIYYILPNEYLAGLELGDENHTYFEWQEDLILDAWKKYIISTKGELGSEWADYDSLVLGKTHYGWELVKERISPIEIETLKDLKIVM